MEEKKEDKIIKEFSLTPEKMQMASGVFKVIRVFYLQITNGPNVAIQPEQLVKLSKDTASTLFCIGKIEPLDMPSQFKVLRRFKMIEHGRYVDLREGDILEIEDREEALSYWRKGYVTPIEEA